MKPRILSAILLCAGVLLFAFNGHTVENKKTGKRPSVSGTKSVEIVSAPKPIHYVKVEGIVNPVMAEYIEKSIAEAVTAKAGVVILELDTPGGLDLSMRTIIKAMLASEVPIVVYVAPSGSRAASAGVFITYASHVAAMAPGTNIGSAHPVAMGGQKMDETMSKKVENDAAAYIKGIAAKKKRNEEWAEKAVRESVNITAEDALKLKVIEIVAPTREELLAALDGRKVETALGLVTISSKGATLKDVKMNMRSRILDALSNPNVAYILMMIGLVGLYFELSNPGVVLPGVLGAICLVLAFYSMQTLSVSYAGLALIGLAFIFFVLEIYVTSFGLLGVAGVVSLLLGSLMLIDSPFPFMRVSLAVIIPAVLIASAFFAVLMYMAVNLHKKKSVSGAEGIIGEEGTAIEDIGMEPSGENVFVAGEYWKAVSDSPVEKGARVKVVSIKGLILKIVRL